VGVVAGIGVVVLVRVGCGRHGGQYTPLGYQRS
jgi:hypothetical protein